MGRLGLAYIVLYPYLDTTRTRDATFKSDNFLYDSWIQHEISELELNELIHSIK